MVSKIAAAKAAVAVSSFSTDKTSIIWLLNVATEVAVSAIEEIASVIAFTNTAEAVSASAMVEASVIAETKLAITVDSANGSTFVACPAKALPPKAN